MTTEITLTKVQEIAELIRCGIESWTRAGELTASALDSGEYTLSSLAEETGVSKEMLARFEQIGREQLYPMLLASTSPGARALRKCTYSEQVKYYNEPVPILLEGGDVLNVPLDNLTPEQTKQAFSRYHAKDLGEQRAHLESSLQAFRTRRLAEVEDQTGYTIQRGRVTFTQGTTLTKDDLIRILARV